MSTRVPITIEGNLTADPESGVSGDGRDWTRFSVAVTDRRFNEDTNRYEDGETVFHNVAVFGAQAKNVAQTLSKGDAAVVSGNLTFRQYQDKDGNAREGRQILADVVGPSLRFRSATIDRTPHGAGVNSPQVAPRQETGPVAWPTAQPGGASATR